jgi:ADP-heptose:LPS heptosyltransferase
MKILLVRPDGIGDEIVCLPVAAALRRLMPEARIAFLSSDHAAPILDHHPDIDEVLTITGRERFRDLVSLFRQGFDAAIFLKPFRRLMLAAFVARVPKRVATGYRWYSGLANRRVYEHRHDFSKHESEYNLGLLRGLGMEPGPLLQPSLILTEGEREWAQARILNLPATRIVVHPGGLSSRLWKAEHYWNLVLRCAREGFGVVLTGNQAEQQQFYSDKPRGQDLGDGILDLMGRLTLREMMAVIGVSQALVSGSTGPAHVAAALGIPTVSVFDPRRKELPIRWRPLGKGFVLRPDVPTCEKCIYEACPYWDCLDRITVDGVVARIRQALDRVESLAVLHV